MEVTFEGGEFLRGSTARTAVPVYMPVILEPRLPERAFVGEQAVIGAGLVDLLGNPVEEGRLLVKRGSRDLAAGEFGPDGTAKVGISLDERGIAALSLHYDASGYYLETSTEAALPVFLITQLAWGSVESGHVGTAAILAGELRDFQGNPLGPLSVGIFDGADLIRDLETGNDGDFSFTFTTEEFGVHDLSARFVEQDFMTAANAGIELEVLIDTSASVSLEGTVDAGEPADFTVALLDERGAPVESGLVEVSSIASDTVVVPVVNGRARGTLTFEQMGDVTVTAVYQPNGPYLTCQASKRTPVRMPTRLELAVETEPAIVEDFELTGRLLTVFGDTVVVPVVNGRARGTLTFEQMGDVTVTAVYQPNGPYLTCQASKRTPVRMPTRLELAVETEPAIVEDFELTGRLLTVFGAPVPGKSVVLEKSDGGESQRAVTFDDGSFSVTLRIASPGGLTISAGFDRDGDFNASRAETTLEVIPVVLETALSSFLIRGEPGEISGMVYRGTQPFGGQTVLVELDGRPVGQTRSDASGNFIAKVRSEYDTSLGIRQITARLPRVGFVETGSVPIKSRTSILTDGPESAHEGSDL